MARMHRLRVAPYALWQIGQDRQMLPLWDPPLA
jgi:hypothetical protein